MAENVIPFPARPAKMRARRPTGPTIKTCNRLEQMAIAVGDWDQANIWRRIAAAVTPSDAASPHGPAAIIPLRRA